MIDLLINSFDWPETIWHTAIMFLVSQPAIYSILCPVTCSKRSLMSVSNNYSAHAQHVGYFIYRTFDCALFKLATVAPDKVGAILPLEAWAIFA